MLRLLKSLWILAVLLNSTLIADAQPELSLEKFATGLSVPVDITHAGDDRIFVVEKAGLIRIVTSEGNLMPEPFLDIRDKAEDCIAKLQVLFGFENEEKNFFGIAKAVAGINLFEIFPCMDPSQAREDPP